MTITIVSVHPTVTMVSSADGQAELPTAWFPVTPKPGQEWIIAVDHLPTDAEKLDQLNALLIRD